jgi:hypothetical protein
MKNHKIVIFIVLLFAIISSCNTKVQTLTEGNWRGVFNLPETKFLFVSG